MKTKKDRRLFRGKFGSWVPSDEKSQQRLLIVQTELKKFIQALEARGIVVEGNVVPFTGSVDLFREIKIKPVATTDGGELVLLHKIEYNRCSTDTARGEKHVKKAESIGRVYKSKPYSLRFKTFSYGSGKGNQ